MAFRYSAICNCGKAECAGVATTETDAHRAMDWFEKRLGTDHAEHVVSRELYNPDALKEQLDAATARVEAAEADARECRAERARYGDMMTEKLAAVEADRIAARALAFRMRRGRDAARDDCRLLVERVKAVTPYAVNTASWVTLLATIGIEPEDMHFSK